MNKKTVFTAFFTVLFGINTLSAATVAPIDTSNLPAPYKNIEVLPFNPQGWYLGEQTMEWLLKTHKCKVAVEIGCWLGRSTRHIAKTLPEKGVVYAVDHWLGSPNEDNSMFDMKNLFRQFLSNAIHENVAHKIIPVKMSSKKAAIYLKEKNVKPDLVYIDATHDFKNVLADLSRWYPFVKGHGILCGDDYFWGHDLPVKQAVDLFAKQNNLTIHNDGWFWWAEENK